MKICFIGIQPSSALKSILLTPPYEAEFLAKLSHAKLKAAEVVVYRVASQTHFDSLEQISKEFPQASFVLVVASKQLLDPKFYESLIRFEAKESVWIEETWELLFWSSLQEVIQRKTTHSELKHLKQTVRTLKEDVASLTKKSTSLVQRFEKNLDVALSLQRSLLPKATPSIPGIDITTKYVPSTGIGGDYYDIFEFGDRRRFGILLADSKSHGLAAALLSALVKIRLEEVKELFPDSISFVQHLTNELAPITKTGYGSMALFYAILDRVTLELRFTAAGRLHPMIWRDGRVLKTPFVLSGEIGPNATQLHESYLRLVPGDILLLHTDGLNEALGKAPQEAWSKILKNEVQDPLELRNRWMAWIDRHCEKRKLQDDLTVIQLCIDEKALFLAGENK